MGQGTAGGSTAESWGGGRLWAPTPQGMRFLSAAPALLPPPPATPAPRRASHRPRHHNPAQVPFEALRRTSRDRKYAVDALASAAASLDEAAERAARGAPATTADAAALVDSLADRLSALKRKARWFGLGLGWGVGWGRW